MSLLNVIAKECMHLQVGSSRAFIPSLISVRYRYWKDKIERGPLLNLGYKDVIITKGPLPHSKQFKNKVHLREFVPKNSWRPKVAMKGQNDYIDILGTGRVRPSDVSYEVPPWLRGFRGNEYQMLIRRKALAGDKIREHWPQHYKHMLLRMKYLHYFLNHKTRDGFWYND